MSMLFPSVMFFAGSVFIMTLLMNLVRKKASLVFMYLVQSLIITWALFALSLNVGSSGLIVAAILTLAVKVVLAPLFFMRLIREHNAHFSASSYLSVPLTLFVLAAATAYSYSIVSPALEKYNATGAIPALFASILGALVLMLNRPGALSSVIGILSLENAMVLFAAYLGVEHSYALEFAIGFDIAVWILIASSFLHMIYQQFGVHGEIAKRMNKLTEE